MNLNWDIMINDEKIHRIQSSNMAEDGQIQGILIFDFWVSVTEAIIEIFVKILS